MGLNYIYGFYNFNFELNQEHIRVKLRASDGGRLSDTPERCTFNSENSNHVKSFLGVSNETALSCAALVAEELRVNASGADVALLGDTLDTVTVLLPGLVVSGVVLRLCHCTKAT